MKIINKGVCSPQGFIANGISCGIKKSGRKDLALIYSQAPAKCAAMFTSNKFQAAPIFISKKHLKNKSCRAIIINSGNANCATGKSGLMIAVKMCSLAARALGLKASEVLVASTGIIGVGLKIENISLSMPRLIKGLSKDSCVKAASAILTTDTKIKQSAIKISIGNKIVSIGTMAKGAGMIYPDLKHATMLCFITTDANISRPVLNAALREAVKYSFNCISVDGCMSTNDSVFILANGLAQNKSITLGTSDYSRFVSALTFICLDLAKKIVIDAEGATKFVKIVVKNARSESDAKKVAVSVVTSTLLKAAVFGEDENWGRIIASVGASGVNFNPQRVKINFTSFKKRDINIIINLNMGRSHATMYTSDLSLEYVKINARYN